MVKGTFLCMILICSLTLVKAQSTLTATLNSYSESQKRLLAKNTGTFLYMVNQGQWDLDSCVLYACKIYGLNRQFPYNETISNGNTQQEIHWLGNNRVSEVIQSAQKASGEKRIQVLLELANYYLHKPGSRAADLDNTAVFLSEADAIAVKLNSKKWKIECNALLGEFEYQKGDQQKSIQHFAAVVNDLNNLNDKKRTAIAWQQLGLHLPYNDTTKLQFFEKALAAFTELKLDEHAIEILSNIATTYFLFNWTRSEVKLNEMLALEKKTGYKHVMDAYYVISFLKNNQRDYFGIINAVDSAVASMTITGDSTLYSLCCLRLGGTYHGLGESQKAINWFVNGMSRRGHEPQLFWYKNLIGVRGPMGELNKFKEYGALLTRITAEFPPQGIIDSTYITILVGRNYINLKELKKAEPYINQFLKYLGQIPPMHVHNLAPFGYAGVAEYYYGLKQYSMARNFLNKILTLTKGREDLQSMREAYYRLYTIDSIEGKHQNALFNYMKFRYYQDSVHNLSQKFRSQELNVKYATEKKDQNIQILTQQALINQSALQQAQQTRNIILGGALLLLVIIGLLYNQYRVKQNNAKLIEQKNSKLVQLVNEKEWLLKEVHHRVKNNLQTVVSLLELQSEYLSQDALAAIQASQSRIYATSLLHQKLYQDDNVSSVNMHTYVPEFIYYLKEAYNLRNEIEFVIDISSVDLDISQAVPIGLIVNEVITNSIKYAFTQNSEPARISVSFKTISNGRAVLTIADNGSGLPATVQKNGTGLGLKLVRGLTEDIDGELSIETTNGTSITIHFEPRTPLSTITNQLETSILTA